LRRAVGPIQTPTPWINAGPIAIDEHSTGLHYVGARGCWVVLAALMQGLIFTRRGANTALVADFFKNSTSRTPRLEF
jgi:hypothetical protein